jgi:hypothetical protein
MTERSAGTSEPFAGREERFDAETARRILRLAAEEQHRLEDSLTDSYSLEELEEIAAETGISRAAVHAAIAAERRQPEAAGAGGARLPEDGRRGWLASLESWLPARWPTTARRIVLAGIVVALFTWLATLPVIGPVILWVAVLSLMLLFVLALLGVSAF